jgi:hypothetical protein
MNSLAGPNVSLHRHHVFDAPTMLPIWSCRPTDKHRQPHGRSYLMVTRYLVQNERLSLKPSHPPVNPNLRLDPKRRKVIHWLRSPGQPTDNFLCFQGKDRHQQTNLHTSSFPVTPDFQSSISRVPDSSRQFQTSSNLYHTYKATKYS